MLEWARHREPVTPSAQASLGGRAAVYRAGRLAPRQGCCQEPAIPSAQVWPREQTLPVVPAAQRTQAAVSASRRVPARGGPQELLREAGSELGARRMALAGVWSAGLRVAV